MKFNKSHRYKKCQLSIRHIFSTSFSVVCSTKMTNTFIQPLLVIQTDKVVYRRGALNSAYRKYTHPVYPRQLSHHNNDINHFLTYL